MATGLLVVVEVAVAAASAADAAECSPAVESPTLTAPYQLVLHLSCASQRCGGER